MGEPERLCFVIMPISDAPGYEPGHFDVVYEHLIKPACLQAGFVPLRADEVDRTNFIVLDILQQLIASDMVVCDLSSRNPNVMYELGIRQAFNKPVTIIRDSKTERVFDIQGLRDLPYDESLRIDYIKPVVEKLSALILNNSQPPTGDVNSLIQLLGINAATEPTATKMSAEAAIILNAVTSANDRLSNVEAHINDILMFARASSHKQIASPVVRADVTPRQGIAVGDTVKHGKFGLGTVTRVLGEALTVDFTGVGQKTLIESYVSKAEQPAEANP